MRLRVLLLLATSVALLNGCARKAPTAVAVLPPPIYVVPTPVVAPRPPMGAAANLRIPVALPDGSYATPNRGLTGDAALWHLRSALNVAALQCNVADSTGVANYNRLLRVHSARFTAAHRALEAEYRRGGGDWRDRFDDAMTRVYNYFAQPPVRDQFCATAMPMLAQVADIPAGGLDGFAGPGLASLEQPFTDFYRAYDRYRIELTAWQNGQAPAVARAPGVPVLTVDPAQLVASSDVTMGDVHVPTR